MSEYINALHDKYLRQSADDHISIEKNELAKRAALPLMDRLERQIAADVALFADKFSANRIEIVTTPKGEPRVRTRQLPCHGVDYSFASDRIEFRRFESQDGSVAIFGPWEAILVKANLEGQVWFEYKGGKLPLVPDVSTVLLAEVLKNAVPSVL